MKSATLTISAVWLRRIGDRVEVLVECPTPAGNRWFRAISEPADACMSHAAHAVGADHWPPVDFGREDAPAPAKSSEPSELSESSAASDVSEMSTREDERT